MRLKHDREQRELIREEIQWAVWCASRGNEITRVWSKSFDGCLGRQGCDIPPTWPRTSWSSDDAGADDTRPTEPSSSKPAWGASAAPSQTTWQRTSWASDDAGADETRPSQPSNSTAGWGDSAAPAASTWRSTWDEAVPGDDDTRPQEPSTPPTAAWGASAWPRRRWADSSDDDVAQDTKDSTAWHW